MQSQRLPIDDANLNIRTPEMTMFELKQTFFFEAAHTLTRRIGAEGSKRIHGHTYQAEVSIVGVKDHATGMVTDLGRLRDAVSEVKLMLDHQLLDDVEGLGTPTLENLCEFVWRQLLTPFPHLESVRIGRGATGDSCLLRRTAPAAT